MAQNSLKAIIFDLDDTLLDTWTLLIPIAKTPAFFERIQRPLPLMPQAIDNLNYCHGKYDLFLLTQGNIQSQKQKVASLGIGHFFKDQFFADPSTGETKEKYFAQLAQLYKPSEALSIGNRRSTDIRLAKRCGLQTCLFQYGEHQSEQIECAEDHPDFTVLNHLELIKKCQL